jgi:CRISPR/Cas system-associated exonuclease Cas4 (RecB family)
MKKFATLVIEDLLRRSNYDLSDYILITPGKRTSIFLKYTLSQIIEKPVLSPTPYTIQQFIEKYSNLDQIETIPAILKLYELYKHKVANPESIEQFWFFGEMILADFDDIDKYLVDASRLFKYIVDIKEIDALFEVGDEDKLHLVKKFWEALYKGSGQTDKNKIRGRFLHFWKILNPLYEEFRTELNKEHKGYDGMLYRLVAEKAANGTLDLKGKIPVFIGFNALSASERKIFSYFKDRGGLFYWDYDQWYVNDELQEAGFFMRQNLKLFPNALTNNTDFDNLSSINKLKVIGVPGELEMAQELNAQVDAQFSDSNDPSENGIILGDETLLIPALHSLSSSNVLNITMGLPLRSTSVFGIISLLLEMPRNRKKINGEIHFSAQWVVNILQQPVWLDSGIKNLLEKIREQNRFYLRHEELSMLTDAKACFPNETVDIISYLKEILVVLVDQEGNNPRLSEINIEAALKVYRALNQIEKQISIVNAQVGQSMVINLIQKVIASINITLEGEPLKGNQLMGLIEARALDFDNLIIVSANEGFLPSASAAPSFIPYNLRKAYGLLTYEHQDAIFAYYFYRAVQRSSNLTFIYNSNENDNNYGEMSRFLQQMAFELNAEIFEVKKTHQVQSQLPKDIIIEKNEEIQKELNRYLTGERLMYPLQLNTFLNCRLKYYFTYIAGLKEPEKIEPGVDQRIFGLIFHETMESLYGPFVELGRAVSKDELQNLDNEKFIQEKITESMQKYFSDIMVHRGENGMVELIEQVVLRYVKRMIKNDVNSELFNIIGLENKYVCDYTFGDQKQIKLAGKIDRLHQTENKLWVIDYKTGRTPVKSKINFSQLFDFEDSDRSDGAFQAYMYAKIMEAQSFANELEMVPSLLYIQDDKPPKEVVFSDRKSEGYNQLKGEFEEGLNGVLLDLFDPAVKFVQTEDHSKCSYCQFKVICQRR